MEIVLISLAGSGLRGRSRVLPNAHGLCQREPLRLIPSIIPVFGKLKLSMWIISVHNANAYRLWLSLPRVILEDEFRVSLSPDTLIRAPIGIKSSVILWLPSDYQFTSAVHCMTRVESWNEVTLMPVLTASLAAWVALPVAVAVINFILYRLPASGLYVSTATLFSPPKQYGHFTTEWTRICLISASVIDVCHLCHG